MVAPVMRNATYPKLQTAHGRQLGDYQLLLQIARGGMADVFLGLAPPQRGGASRRQVVIKLLRSDIVEDEEFRAMFLDEGRLASRLAHPNVVTTFGVGLDGDDRFMVMEFLDGQTLARIRRRDERQGGIPLPVQLRALADVLRGIHYLHELRDVDGRSLGVVHRDVTPQNVFVTYEGHVKVLDLGIAKASSRVAETRIGVVKGKLPYMSPESVRGELVDRRSDLFSVGIMLWEAAVGARFWKDHDELTVYRRLIAGDLPLSERATKRMLPGLREIVLRSVTARPEDRFTSAAEMQVALEKVLLTFEQWGSRAFLREHVATTFAEEREAFHEQVHAELVRLDAGRASAPPSAPQLRMVSTRQHDAPLSQSSPGTDMTSGYGDDLDAAASPATRWRLPWPVAMAAGSLVLSLLLFTYALRRYLHRPSNASSTAQLQLLTITAPVAAAGAPPESAVAASPAAAESDNRLPDAVVPVRSPPAVAASMAIATVALSEAARRSAALNAKRWTAPKPVDRPPPPPGEVLPRTARTQRALDARDPWSE